MLETRKRISKSLSTCGPWAACIVHMDTLRMNHFDADAKTVPAGIGAQST